MKRLVLSIVFIFSLLSCSEKAPQSEADRLLDGKKPELVFSDDFNRSEPGQNYKIQGGDWKIRDGALVSTTAKNRNIVLSGVELPENAVIELTMMSRSDAVDVKFNLWGDGGIHDHGDGYTFILGGWKNRISVISKLDEHEKGRSESRKKLEKSHVYHSKVIRISKDIYWFVDGELFLKYRDAEPLKTADGFNRLSFGNWKSDVAFDDLKIYKIK